MKKRTSVNPQNIDQLSAFKLFSLININKKINSLMELDQLLELIMDSCKTLINAEGSSLMLINHEKQVLTFNIVTGQGQELKELEIPLGKGIAGYVAQTGEPQIINDAQKDMRVYKEADQITSMITKNILCVPMTTGGKIIGVLEAINAVDREEFSNDDLLLLMAFAEQAAVSITNRKLYDRMRARAEELSALHEISQLAVKHGDNIEILQESLNIVSKVMNAEKCSILLHDSNQRQLTMQAEIGVNDNKHKTITIPFFENSDKSIALKVFNEGKFIFSENIERDPRFKRATKKQYSTGSFVSVPMQTNEKVMGVLSVTDKKNGTPFNIFDVRLLQTISNQISEVYENIRLYEEEKTKLNMQKELEITRRLQEAIFPKQFPELNDVDIYAINISAKEVGGDFYDFFPATQDKETFSAVIADVSGKSVPAALFMAISRSIIRALAIGNQEKTPSELLNAANKLIIKDSESAMFVTAFFLKYNATEKKITFSNGGHNPPILYRHKTQTIEHLHTTGKPLGVIEEATYNEKTISIEKNDIIVLYTDGIVEADNADQEQFGIKRLEQVIYEYAHLSATELGKKITESVTIFAGNAPQFDDITLFVFRFDQ